MSYKNLLLFIIYKNIHNMYVLCNFYVTLQINYVCFEQ